MYKSIVKIFLLFIWETIMELKKFLMNNEKIVRLFIPQLRYRTKVNTGKTSWLNARPVPDVCP